MTYTDVEMPYLRCRRDYAGLLLELTLTLALTPAPTVRVRVGSNIKPKH